MRAPPNSPVRTCDTIEAPRKAKTTSSTANGVSRRSMAAWQPRRFIEITLLANACKECSSRCFSPAGLGDASASKLSWHPAASFEWWTCVLHYDYDYDMHDPWSCNGCRRAEVLAPHIVLLSSQLLCSESIPSGDGMRLLACIRGQLARGLAMAT